MSTIPKAQYELSDNVHPNVDRSPWGWIVIKGTRLRVATYSGYEEKERCKKLIESAQLATDGREELEKELAELKGAIKSLEESERQFGEQQQEVERLKGLIEKLFKSPTHQAAMRAFDIDPEPEWEAFKQESNL